MRRSLKLRTDDGYDVRIILENWGSGLDHSMRRWTLQDGLWQCMDSGDFAEERTFGFRRPVARSSHAPVAAHANEAAGDVHEAAAAMRGQTMVEYALIIAAIGVVAWGAFHLTGRDISSMASGIDSSLTNT
jgi:Flp pilus assembly pilin Flp